MKMSKYLAVLILVLATFSCASNWQVVEASSAKIPIDSTTDRIADKEYVTYLQPVTTQINEELNVVIGQAAETMATSRPESLLSNLASEVLRDAATKHIGQPVDIAIMNMGGLRTQINKGDITLRKIFELMPFENELVVLWLKGDVLQKVIEEIAAVGGQGETGIRMTIKDHKPQDVTINGKPLDINEIYTIATNDFMAGGNDKLEHLAAYEKRENTGLTIRSVFIEAVKAITESGKKVEAKLDGRISVEN
ncbi:MAG: 5'-nucleotidase C-terminal domain-containing protein [Paludibacter sp.]|jgi:2',3'-cyclic-nucleotide 2'-phosphodiesterase (5'-nucleotidase family)|nr:5'-nucleotidase C-terminal domain-containing protein [Paludibacter sp.]